MTDTLETNIELAVGLIKSADGILVSSGAGIGIDSGLPDFRGGEGLWTAYPKLSHLSHISFVEMCHPKAMRDNYELVMGWYAHRLLDYRATIPHRGYNMLLEIAQSAPGGYWGYTSNVDGQWQKSGWPEDRLVECHGSVHWLQCEDKCHSGVWSADNFHPVIDIELCELTSEPPRCTICNARARPNVMMFSDHYFSFWREDLQFWPFHKWAKSLDKLVVIEVGAGIAIPTVRMMGAEYSPNIIRINPSHTECRDGDISIPLGALEGITLLHSSLSK